MLENPRNVVILILLALNVLFGIALGIEYHRANTLERDNGALVAGVEFQNAQIKSNEVNMTKIANLPIEKAKNATIYKDRLVYVQTFKEDKNVTNCENAINLLRDYNASGLLR